MGRTLIVIAVCFFVGVLGIVIATAGRRPRRRAARNRRLELQACPACGYLNRNLARYCAQCGQTLDASGPTDA